MLVIGPGVNEMAKHLIKIFTRPLPMFFVVQWHNIY